jgi:mono/diheme cytochrome c family protein
LAAIACRIQGIANTIKMSVKRVSFSKIIRRPLLKILLGDKVMSFLQRLLATKFVSMMWLLALGTSSPVAAQSAEITFHKDIEPILQRSCQNCHRDGGVGPMPLVTYDQVAPFAGLIEYKTGLRDRAGAMPPWYMEKNIGIQGYKNDPSLSDVEIAAISDWARNGAPRGDSTDSPEALNFDDSLKWTAGQPDLIVKTNSVTKLSGTADWWGEIDRVPVGLDEDRYVKSVEVVEVNDVENRSFRKKWCRIVFISVAPNPVMIVSNARKCLNSVSPDCFEAHPLARRM